jgi:hypothetical protein
VFADTNLLDDGVWNQPTVLGVSAGLLHDVFFAPEFEHSAAAARGTANLISPSRLRYQTQDWR